MTRPVGRGAYLGLASFSREKTGPISATSCPDCDLASPLGVGFLQHNSLSLLWEVPMNALHTALLIAVLLAGCEDPPILEYCLTATTAIVIFVVFLVIRITGRPRSYDRRDRDGWL